jgi:hypothetical protein
MMSTMKVMIRKLMPGGVYAGGGLLGTIHDPEWYEQVSSVYVLEELSSDTPHHDGQYTTGAPPKDSRLGEKAEGQALCTLTYASAHGLAEISQPHRPPWPQTYCLRSWSW